MYPNSIEGIKIAYSRSEIMKNLQGKIKNSTEVLNRGDYPTSFEKLKPLAEQGDAKAQFNLGFLYRIGQGIQQDYHKAYHWYSLAAGQGYPEAQYKIGLMYYKGQVVAKSYQKAFEWYSLAAIQSNAKVPQSSNANPATIPVAH